MIQQYDTKKFYHIFREVSTFFCCRPAICSLIICRSGRHSVFQERIPPFRIDWQSAVMSGIPVEAAKSEGRIPGE